jgi:hypothetical protein
VRFARARPASSWRVWPSASVPLATAISHGFPRRAPKSPTICFGSHTASAVGRGLCFLYLRSVKRLPLESEVGVPDLPGSEPTDQVAQANRVGSARTAGRVNGDQSMQVDGLYAQPTGRRPQLSPAQPDRRLQPRSLGYGYRLVATGRAGDPCTGLGDRMTRQAQGDSQRQVRGLDREARNPRGAYPAQKAAAPTSSATVAWCVATGRGINLFESISEVREHATHWVWTCSYERLSIALGGIPPKKTAVGPRGLTSTSGGC